MPMTRKTGPKTPSTKSTNLKKVIVLNKKEGETPLQALERFRAGRKKYEKVKLTYAGRLDPLASGLLLILAGDAVREKEKYLGLTKEYAFEILFGFATDTHDILGKISNSTILTNIRIEDIKRNIKFFTGKFEQKYPLYSSKTVKRARKGEKVTAPEHMVEVKSFKFLKLRKITGRKLLQDIKGRIGKVEGDFRQKEILNIWHRYLTGKESGKFFIGRFHVKCGSGMYVRRLSQDLGDKMGMPALAYKIKRTKIGKFAKITGH